MATTYRTESAYPHAKPTDPTTAIEELASPFRLGLPALLREQGQLWCRAVAGGRPGRHLAERLAAVDAALARGGAR